jgi:dephospho-CoA kinase
VLSWGVTQEQIEAVLGLPMPAENLMVIKDFVLENGLDFETVKTELQVLVDAR